MRTALVMALALACTAAQAQEYPNRAVRVVVAAATGGPDIVARIVAAELQAQMGQPFVVENQGGAAGVVGTAAVARAAPDGYTLLVHTTGLVSSIAAHKSLPYDVEKDLTPVTSLVNNSGLFFAVATNIPPKTLQEFIDYAKKSPAPLAYGTPGIGNPLHLAMELFANVAGLKMTHIPYKGGGPAAAALATGEVQAMFMTSAPLMPYYKSGKVRVLAFTSNKRHPAAPEVPTTAEAGMPQFRHDGGWFGMFVPAGTPTEIVNKLWREVQVAEQKPQVLERFRAIGVEPVANSPADFKNFTHAEIKAYAEQARLAGIQPE
jgi:tripartite-type tricarboxylate transporter receptor subunit TctC